MASEENTRDEISNAAAYAMMGIEDVVQVKVEGLPERPEANQRHYDKDEYGAAIRCGLCHTPDLFSRYCDAVESFLIQQRAELEAKGGRIAELVRINGELQKLVDEACDAGEADAKRANDAEAIVTALRSQLERATDLVRYMRGELREAKLISLEEWTDLVADSEGGQRVARLQGYDALSKQLATARAEITAGRSQYSAYRHEAKAEYARYEAALATAEQEGIRKAAEVCQKRADALMHEDGHYDESTDSWAASNTVLDHIEGWDEAKNAITALLSPAVEEGGPR